MSLRQKLWSAIAAAAAVALNFAMAGAFTKAVDSTLGPPWTYVLHFALGMSFGALLLMVKHVAAYIRTENKPSETRAFARWQRVRRIAGPYLLFYAGWELKQLHQFKSGWRKRVRDFGALPAAIAASLAVGPVLAAFFMRQMGVPEFRAWLYVTVAGAITTLTMVTGALGAIDVIWNMFH